MQSQRLQKLRTRMDAQGLDAVVITSPENRYYLSNFRGSSGCLVITETQSLLFTDFRYVSQAREQATLYEVVQHGPSMFVSVADFIRKFGTRHLGVEMGTLPVNDYLLLKRELPQCELVDVEPTLYAMRMFKDEEELAYIRQGVAICDQAFTHILKFIRPGMTEREIGLELEFAMRRAGAEGIKANHVIASGERAALPHGQATDRVLRPGDLFTMDFGARVRGYYSDFTRTVVIGEPSAKQREIYGIVHRAQLAALAAIGPGKVCSDLDEVGRSIIRDAGYGDNFGHSLGHSIGLAVHEKPRMQRGDDTVLKPGMVISVEPGIYIDGFGGVRIEDLIAITEDGYENFTHSTKELLVIPA